MGVIKEEFMRSYNFPGCIGAIDCTHIAIIQPSIEEHNFLNRKGFHSLNVQVVCDSNMKILNINANFPGSNHDSFIWRQSRLKEFVDGLYNSGMRGHWLIGDSGYPLEPCVMTPILNAVEGSPESRYNYRHAVARSCVERCIGLLKMRFRCILQERTARYSPHFVGRLVNACAVLHNMCIIGGVPFENANENVDNEVDMNNFNNHFNYNVLNEGRMVRQNIVNRYFLNN